jgi:hypothetical protein
MTENFELDIECKKTASIDFKLQVAFYKLQILYTLTSVYIIFISQTN